MLWVAIVLACMTKTRGAQVLVHGKVLSKGRQSVHWARDTTVRDVIVHLGFTPKSAYLYELKSAYLYDPKLYGQFVESRLEPKERVSNICIEADCNLHIKLNK